MQVSIIIPTFNERENVVTISERIRNVMKTSGVSYEIWFIDDSRDNTPKILAELAEQYDEVHFYHRTEERGLGTAVVEGFRRASGEYLVIMDADLQHPPELIPTVVDKLVSGVEVVVPSRFVVGGSDGGLNLFRRLVSWTARSIGRLAIQRLRSITDCTGGFFGVHRSVIDDANLNPIGWKILMEVLVNGHYSSVHEIPYSFTARDSGESKMSAREQWNYLRHVWALVWNSPDDRRFYLFCGVGGLGAIVNLVVMSVLVYQLRWPSAPSSIVASLIAMGHNFLWNDQVTWKDAQVTKNHRKWVQFPLFVMVSLVSIGITALFAWGFETVHWHVLLGQFLGIAMATMWSYTANNRWTWKRDGTGPARVSGKIVVTRDKV